MNVVERDEEDAGIYCEPDGDVDDERKMVCDYWIAGRGWDWSRLKGPTLSNKNLPPKTMFMTKKSGSILVLVTLQSNRPTGP